MIRAFKAFCIRHLFLISIVLLVFSQLVIAKTKVAYTGESNTYVSSFTKDTAHINSLHNASKKVIFSNQDSAIFYAQEAERLSEKLNYLPGLAYSQYIIAYANTLLSNYSNAYHYYSKALSNFSKDGNKTYIAKTYNELGIIYKDLGKYKDAISYYQKALKISEEIGDSAFSIKLLINSGVVYMKMNDYKESASLLFRALQKSEEQENFNQVALIHGNLGNLYMEQEVYSEAKDNFSIALSYFKDSGNKRMEAVALNNLGKIFTKLKENDKAIAYYNDAFVLFNALQDSMAIADSQKHLGILYANNREYKVALDYYKTALNLYTQVQNEIHLAELYALIGGAYLQNGELDNADSFLKKAIENESEISNSIDKLALYEHKYKYHEAVRSYREALFFYKKYDSLRGELFNNQKLQEINDIENRYLAEKGEKEKQQLKIKEIQQRELLGEQEVINKFLVIGIVLFLITVVHFYRLYKSKKNTNHLLEVRNIEIERQKEEIVRINSDLKASQDKLQDANGNLSELNHKLNNVLEKKTNLLNQTNEELDTFFYQSSHALRRPLVHFKGLLEILKLEQQEINRLDIYKKLDYTSNKMDVMLSKLVMASEVNLERIRDQKIDFKKIIDSVWVFLGLKYNTNLVKLNLRIDEDIEYRSNIKLIEILFQNLIENAINFSVLPELRETNIDINISEESAYLKIIFKDNGIGISEEQLPKIFRMFTVSSHLSEGFGLGLYIVKKVINKLRGHISVKSVESEFTSFTIVLPKQKNMYLEEIKLLEKNR